MCGLKLLVINTIRICNLVASLADVWIKILKNQGMTFNAIVASFADAWIKKAVIIRFLSTAPCIVQEVYDVILLLPHRCILRKIACEYFFLSSLSHFS